MTATLKDIITKISIPLYHSKGPFDHTQDDLLKLLTEIGVDVNLETPITKLACKKHWAISPVYERYDNEFYQRFAEIVWICKAYDADLKTIVDTLLNIDNLERFGNIWCFFSTCNRYRMLPNFIATNKISLMPLLTLLPTNSLRVSVTC